MELILLNIGLEAGWKFGPAGEEPAGQASQAATVPGP